MKTLENVYRELSKIEDEMYVKRCCGSCEYCPFETDEDIPCIGERIIELRERVLDLNIKLEDL